jgi:hypothetical protein
MYLWKVDTFLFRKVCISTVASKYSSNTEKVREQSKLATQH